MIVLAPLAIVLEKWSGLVHFSKEVLIIVIKLTQGRDHRSGGSFRVDTLKIFFKKIDQNNDVFNQKSFFQKKNQVEGRVLPETIESWFDSGFWPSQVGSLVLFFLQSKSIQALGRPGLKYEHLGNPPTYRYAQIWTLSYFLDDTIKEAIH